MKNLFNILTILAVSVFAFSCGDDDEDPLEVTEPLVSQPTLPGQQTGASGTATFFVAIADNVTATWTATSTGGVTLASNSGTVAGASVDVNFTTTASGAASITLSVTDSEGRSATNVVNFNVTGEISVEAPIIDVFSSGDGTGSVTWTKDNIYALRGFIFVNEGQTLTIEPGTVVKGQPGEGAGASALIVAKGGKINAVGTASEPIIFTSLTDELSPANIQDGNFGSPNLTATQNGRWGGLIILGNAIISAANDDDQDVSEAQIEGIPSSETRGIYGGSDDADDSGELQYISIRHGGSLIGAGNEINGLTLGGVGSATTIANIEVVANQDDGVEWFGGSVDITNLLVWNSGDDAVDTDQDWIGTLDNFIVVTPRGGSAFELDGPEGSGQGGFHSIDNGTIYAGDAIDHLVDWDGNTNAVLNNLYFFGWTADYGFLQDEDPDEEGDQIFNPIESFGGDNSGASSNWEYTLATGDGAADAAEIFAGVDSSILTEVAENSNAVGADASVFAWTWASRSGALAGAGIE